MFVRGRGRALIQGGGLAALVACVVLACREAGHEAAGPLEYVPGVVGEIVVPPPPFSEGAFPCSRCHDPEIPVRRQPRALRFAHTDVVLAHDEEHRWCLDCHDTADRDFLHLAGGELVPFDESYRLCGQCHGDKYRDWRAGAHGRRTGSWDGEKTYLLCVHCHDAHDPAFRPIEPLPPPLPPRRTP